MQDTTHNDGCGAAFRRVKMFPYQAQPRDNILISQVTAITQLWAVTRLLYNADCTWGYITPLFTRPDGLHCRRVGTQRAI